LKDGEAQNENGESASSPAAPETARGIPGEAAGGIDFAKIRSNTRPLEIPESSWTTIIDSRKTLFSFPWKELWDYRDLIYLLFYRDFNSTYKQTVLGPLWYWVQPFMQTMVLTLVFSAAGGMSTDGIPPFLFYLSGMACWTFFADCLNKSSVIFTTNAYLFGKIYFPRLSAPIATVGMCLVNFFMVFSLFLLMYVLFMLRGAHIHPDWRLIVLPVLILQMTMIGMGTGFVVTALTTRYKDLAVVVTFGTQLWMYGSCVIFPLTMIPARYRPFMALNPMVTIIESFRFAFFGVGTVFLWQLITSFVVTLVVFIVGLVLFNKVERTFTDTI
jgi:lipopolysaccharide transport system permease protein